MPISDPLHLSNAILDAIRLSKDNEAWNSLRTAARKHIMNNYSTNNMRNRYNDLWLLKY